MTDPTPQRVPSGPPWYSRFRAPEWGLIVAIGAALGLIYVIQDEHTFFGAFNLKHLFNKTALFGVLSIGAAVVIISGGIDLSIGSVVALSAVVAAKLMTEWLPGLPEAGEQASRTLAGAAAALCLVAGLKVAGWRGLAFGALPAVLVVGLAAFAPALKISQGTASCASLVVAGVALAVHVGECLGLWRLKWLLGVVVASVVTWGLASAASEGPKSAADPSLGLVVAGITLSLLLGLAIGVMHAAMINRFQLPPFIATLATMAGLRSLAIILSGNRTINVNADRFRCLGNDNRYTIPIFATIAVVMSVVLGATVLGRHLYALGGNENAARLSGLSIRRLKTAAYAISGMLAALGGILFAGSNGLAESRMGIAYELYAITAAVVGGCSLAGGVGSIRGTVLGLILIQIVINGTGLLVQDVDPSQIEGLVLGTVVVLAVAFNQGFRKRI